MRVFAGAKRRKDSMSGKSRTLDKLFWLVIMTNVLLPKAGIKAGGVPLTAGSVFLALLILKESFHAVCGRFLKIRTIDLFVAVGVVYWIFRLSVPFVSGGVPIADFISYFAVLVIYPMTFWGVRRLICTERQCEAVFDIINKCIFIVMVYAVIQLFFGIGETAIPGITVNYTDYLERPSNWWMGKNNGIVNGSKMVSTYQNGNILGLCLLLLFPLTYRMPNKRRWAKSVSFILFTVVIFLTGCRSAVLGYGVYGLILVAEMAKRAKVRIKDLAIIGWASVLIVILFVYLLGTGALDALLGRYFGTLQWDTFVSGAGRTPNAIRYISWLMRQRGIKGIATMMFGAFGVPHDGTAYEMTYVCVFLLGGLVGLICFLTPICIVITQCRRRLTYGDNWMVRGILDGIIVYAVVAFVEGAYWLPPTAILLWFVLSLGNTLGSASMRRKGIIENETI